MLQALILFISIESILFVPALCMSSVAGENLHARSFKREVVIDSRLFVVFQIALLPCCRMIYSQKYNSLLSYSGLRKLFFHPLSDVLAKCSYCVFNHPLQLSRSKHAGTLFHCCHGTNLYFPT